MNLEHQQRRLIVHSFIYYELNSNIWTDAQYDKLALEIESKKDTKEYKDSVFYPIFKDWTSATGISLIKGPQKKYIKYYTHFTNLAKDLITYQKQPILKKS